MVQAVARSHTGWIQVAITQNIPLLESVLKRREDVLAWISNLPNKIRLLKWRQGHRTKVFTSASNSKHLFGGMSMNTVPYDPVTDYMGVEQPQGSYSMSEHWHPDVTPDALHEAPQGRCGMGYIVDCYRFQGGQSL